MKMMIWYPNTYHACYGKDITEQYIFRRKILVTLSSAYFHFFQIFHLFSVTVFCMLRVLCSSNILL